MRSSHADKPAQIYSCCLSFCVVLWYDRSIIYIHICIYKNRSRFVYICQTLVPSKPTQALQVTDATKEYSPIAFLPTALANATLVKTGSSASSPSLGSPCSVPIARDHKKAPPRLPREPTYHGKIRSVDTPLAEHVCYLRNPSRPYRPTLPHPDSGAISSGRANIVRDKCERCCAQWFSFQAL